MSDIVKYLITLKYSYYVQSLDNCMVQFFVGFAEYSSNDFP